MKGEAKKLSWFFSILFLIALAVVFKKAVFSYDTQFAHPFFAEKSVVLFNNQNPAGKLTSQEANWVKQGAEEEDTPIRWMNHFYDPNAGYGLPGYAPANIWANFGIAQMTYAQGDQSFNTAISAYVSGDKRRAFIALGHVLHLIEDMAVPAHTRIDIHPEGDPYEEWVKLNTNKKINVADLIKIDNLNQAFSSTANYSNKYFFSKNTINKNILVKLKTEPILKNNKVLVCFINYDENGNKYCQVVGDINFVNPNKNIYYLDDRNHSDYYSLLAPKAISYGAAVIDLFFRQAAEEQNKKLTTLDKLKQTLSKTGSLLSDGLNGLIGKYQAAMTDYSSSLAGVDNAAADTAAGAAQQQINNAGAVLSAMENGEGEGSENPPSPFYQGGDAQGGQNNFSLPPETENQAPINPFTEAGEQAGKKNTISPDSPSPRGRENQARNTTTPIFTAGDTLPPETEFSKKPNKLVNVNSAEFIFEASEANSTFDCRLDDFGWQSCVSPKNLSALADGEHIFKVRAIDPSGNADLIPAEYDWTVDTTAPAIIITDQPAVYASSTSASFSFNADEVTQYYNCSLDENGWPECASSQIYENLAEGSHYFQVKAIDLAGNETATSTKFNWNITLSASSTEIISAPPDNASSTSANFQLASNEIEASFQCQLDANDWQLCSASTTISSLAEGWHAFSARAINQAGNIGSSTRKIWLVDLTAPVSAVGGLPASQEAAGFSVNWSGSDTDAAGATTTASGVAGYDVQYKIGTGEWQNWLEAIASTSAAFDISVDNGVTIYFRSRARDLAGNLEGWPANSSSSTTISAPTANHLLISEVQVSGIIGDDEFIELYNPTDTDVSLNGYSIQYRGSNAQNFYKKNFPSDTIIMAKSYFLIASDAYSGSISPDFIYASFNLSGVGGTIFLANNTNELTNEMATSSVVVDRLSYGSGQYLFPEGTTFTPAPAASRSLERKAFATSTTESMSAGGVHENSGNGYDSDDNSTNFVLKSISWPQTTSGSLEPRLAISSGLEHLWHFDECEGGSLNDSIATDDLPQNSIRIVGKWQCAINQPWQEQYKIVKNFSTSLPAGELTLAYYWRNTDWPNEGRNHLYLKNSANQTVAGITPSIATSRRLHFDGSATSSLPALPNDNNWHFLTVTYSQTKAVLYFDGIEQKTFIGDYTIKTPASSLEIGGENFPVSMDELAIWTRALGREEVLDIFNSGVPLEPYNSPPAPLPAERIHWWHFDEGAGTTTADSVGNLTLNQSAAWSSGKSGSGIEQSWQAQYQISQEITPQINDKNLSLDFWWQNSSFANEGRGSLELQDNSGANIFGVRPSFCSGEYYFDRQHIALANVIPNDNQWHHLALVYNSYDYYLYFYVDGVEKIKTPKIWFRRPIIKLVIHGENWPYKIDELAIWRGALTAARVQNIYQGN